MNLRSPYPYFGGKSQIVQEVWARLGNVDFFVDPFFGSMAMLLGRPGDDPSWIEHVNDADGYLVNFWRAVKNDPDGVTRYAYDLVAETDLTAKHYWLVTEGKQRISRCVGDPDYYDTKVAGWWVWGIAIWIGQGWCRGKGAWVADENGIMRPREEGEIGVGQQLIHLGPGRGVTRTDLRQSEEHLGNYIRALAHRMRNVRVICGDWSRVVTQGALTTGNKVGIFLDPPYGEDIREKGLYIHEANGTDVPTNVRNWCIENGDNPRYRIALCGFEGEHNELEKLGWSMMKWIGRGSYKSSSSTNDNRFTERIWFSQHCVRQIQFSI